MNAFRKLLQVWNESVSADESIPRVAAFFKADSSDKIRRQLKIKFRNYDWERNYPRLGEPRVEIVRDTGAHVIYPMFLTKGEEKFKTYWNKDSYGNWHLRRLQFPNSLK